MDPLEFLRGHQPFDRLGDDALGQVGASLEIAYCAAGTRILQRGGPASRYLYVVRKGTVRLERDGQVVQLIEAGECFGFPSLIGRAAPHADAVAGEETLLYQLPADVFASLMARPSFAEFFLEDLGERLRRATALEPPAVGGGLSAPVAQVSRRPPLWVEPSATVGEAARAMREHGASSVLVSGSPTGIVTDRDLRSRVLADGRGPDTRVGDVATRPVRTLAASATLLDALVFMLEHRVHHVPLETEGAITGLVTDTDLLRWQVTSPVALLKGLDRLAIPDDLPRYARDVAAMVQALHGGGLAAARIGPLVARLNDAFVARLLRRAEESLGPPPGPYAWIVFGSEGRLEQTLLADQDNALIYAAHEGEESPQYFGAMASLVVGWLVDAGFPQCPGGFMATAWCHPLDWWAARFRQWIERPEPRALMDAMNVFDFRRAHGTLPLDPLERLLGAAGREGRFLAHLAHASTGLTPPIGAFHRLKRDGAGVDLKKGGLLPVAGLARVAALEAGSTSRSTLDRLEAAVRGGTLSPLGAATLAEAFRFLLDLRLREQLRSLRAGERPGSTVALDRLTSLEQRHLKDVFVAIREHQRAAAHRYGTDTLA